MASAGWLSCEIEFVFTGWEMGRPANSANTPKCITVLSYDFALKQKYDNFDAPELVIKVTFSGSVRENKSSK